VRQKISARVDGGTSGPSSMRRQGARTPIGASGIHKRIKKGHKKGCLLKKLIKVNDNKIGPKKIHDHYQKCVIENFIDTDF
jgi:hypothetical protein